MKVSLITMHRVPNYGSVLQTYATSKIVEGMGHSVEVIDFSPKRLKLWNTIYEEAKAKNGGLLFPLYLLYSALVNVPKRRIYNQFLKKYVRLSSKRFYSNEDLLAEMPEADVYMTGSDQVWNPYYDGFVELSYFLNFAPSDKRKIAYAASFGRERLDPKEKNLIAPYLKRYDALSVREYQAADLLHEMGFSNVAHVLDPTLLLDKEEWKDMLSNKKYDEKYILMYTVNRDEQRLMKLVKEIATAKGLKIYYIHNGLRDVPGCDRIFRNQSPNDFLNLFAQAEYIIATSFHGTAFALNFNKPFVSILPEKFQARVKSILKIFGLESRMVEEDFSLQTALQEINYAEVNEKMAQERRKSMNFLRNNLLKV